MTKLNPCEVCGEDSYECYTPRVYIDDKYICLKCVAKKNYLTAKDTIMKIERQMKWRKIKRCIYIFITFIPIYWIIWIINFYYGWIIFLLFIGGIILGQLIIILWDKLEEIF